MTGSVLSLQQVARRLEEAGIVWAVFAGAAASVYGSDRPLTDVDILVPLDAGERVAALYPGAVLEREPGGRLYGIKLPDVDIIAGLTIDEDGVAYDVDLDDEMAARRTFHEIAGVRMPVIPAEDNILLKALWGRGAEQGKHDWEDVRAMMAHVDLDWEYLRFRAESCGTVSGRPISSLRRALARLEELRKEKEL
jgi:hypothetical protein